MVLSLRHDWGFLARDAQLPPEDPEWITWLILAGRGFGKTRTGAEWINEQAREGGQGYRIALVGASAADVRDTMIEGESGIIACARPGMVPTYIPSKRRVIWPNGAMATTFSAETPRQLRGPQHHAAWADELCAWRREETLDQLQFTLRLGQKPRVVITTTPRPTAQLKELIASPTTRVSRGKTDENKANLAPSYLTKVVSKYEGTRLGRQELNAEILDDTPGALWTLTQLETLRVKRPPEFKRIIVAVDPTTSEDGKNDEAGIIAVGISEQNVAYVLEDRSGQYSPEEWARVAVELYTDLEADCIVAESNQGGAMVKLILNSACNEDGTKLRSVPVRLVHASRGKRARAEPVAALYEQGRVRHVGVHAKLENEMTTWSAMQGEPSPNRVDALVWGLTELCLSGPHEKPSAKGARRFAGIAPSPRSF